MTLRERARAAAVDHTQTHTIIERAQRCARGLETVLAARRFSATPHRDWQRCEPGTTSPGIVLIYTDGDEQYAFVPYIDDDDFLVLGPCPLCCGQVPRAPIAHLADLGHYLQASNLAEPPEPFYGDPGHHTGCFWRRG